MVEAESGVERGPEASRERGAESLIDLIDQGRYNPGALDLVALVWDKWLDFGKTSIDGVLTNPVARQEIEESFVALIPQIQMIGWLHRQGFDLDGSPRLANELMTAIESTYTHLQRP